jgi:tRNA U34 5-methylaminomethyl-2-thiouridine-forming methyltransferase MnmC
VEFIALLAQHLQPTGKLVTYSCAAAVRKALLKAGLYIASTPSVGRKNPGTIASPAPLDFPALTPAENEYLYTRAAIPYRDESLKDDAETIKKRRYEEQARSNLESTSQWKKRWLAFQG